MVKVTIYKTIKSQIISITIGGLAEFRIDQLKKSYREVLKEDFEGDDEIEIEFLPIEWQSNLKSSFDKINLCTLPTLGVLRRITNEMLQDGYYYFTKFHGQSIVDFVTQAYNTAWENFITRYPSFNGNIGIFAHSLGGVISYDIICNQEAKTPNSHHINYSKLNFRPKFLFSLGTPMSAVLVQRGFSIIDYQLPSWCHYMNIFHLYDPLGYRIEPLFNPAFAAIPPIPITRPSSKRSHFTHWNTLLEKILPGLPEILQLPGLPPNYFQNLAWPNLNHLTDMNNWPHIPSLPNLPEFMTSSFFRLGKRHREETSDVEEGHYFSDSETSIRRKNKRQRVEHNESVHTLTNNSILKDNTASTLSPHEVDSINVDNLESTSFKQSEIPNNSSLLPSIVSGFTSHVRNITEIPANIMRRMSSQVQSNSSTDIDSEVDLLVESAKEELDKNINSKAQVDNKTLETEDNYLEKLSRRYDYFVQETVVGK
ncbi:hypothetical protein HK099_000155 [Clydaea vesicula]|uniref:DDHD domain-containing protein n=1 Tax=Clydaea vesicula TaxID=447962 RepID=A0AAD5Y050_9FUNG|nr:hypothetical protein HK099_000155 [Clydaea vesicula]